MARDASFRDVVIELQFKAVAGQEDQGGGPMWRYQDKGYYYIARYNPLENNYRVYKVVKGRRIQLQSADIPASPGWHKLKVVMVGDHIECYYDGKRALDVKDATFAQAGRVGLWTKADAQTHFDDLTAVAAGAE
ncbi:MAG: hypothetical protein HYU66_06615 [Armatimonadetes bacterium]|nr:hypothetical protein [Armatimonadota bacterium]